MRLEYSPNPPSYSSLEDQAIVTRVQQRRGDSGLLPLDLALLHAPPVADGWNSFLGAIRTKTSLPTSILETAICRVAVLNKAWFEWKHHAPLLKGCSDISDEHIEALLTAPPRESSATPFDERHRAIMEYSDAMTLDVNVPDAVFERLKSHFSDREIVEITCTISAYNCVSRFLVALDVGECNGKCPQPR